MLCIFSLGSQNWNISVNGRLCDFDNLVNFGVEISSHVIVYNSDYLSSAGWGVHLSFNFVLCHRYSPRLRIKMEKFAVDLDKVLDEFEFSEG
jgi:hypothetical protein